MLRFTRNDGSMTRAPSLAPTVAERRRNMIRFEAAVRNISEGLCMFDAESKLVICNERYASIYGLPSELTKPGAAHASIVEYRLAHGMRPVGAEGYFARHQEVVKGRRGGRHHCASGQRTG
jgi:PAS domain-containing protein